jgi:hypothetical protein
MDRNPFPLLQTDALYAEDVSYLRSNVSITAQTEFNVFHGDMAEHITKDDRPCVLSITHQRGSGARARQRGRNVTRRTEPREGEPSQVRVDYLQVFPQSRVEALHPFGQLGRLVRAYKGRGLSRLVARQLFGVSRQDKEFNISSVLGMYVRAFKKRDDNDAVALILNHSFSSPCTFAPSAQKSQYMVRV